MNLRLGISLLAGIAGFGSAGEFDPFAPDASLAAREAPKVVRVQIEFIRVTHADCTKLLAGNRATADATPLRTTLAEMVEDGRAEVVETMMVTGIGGNRATCESIREHIYPTEYEPPVPCGGSWRPSPRESWKMAASGLLRIPTAPTAFETRNEGSTLEMAAHVGGDGETIDLRLAPEMVVLTGHAVYADFIAAGGHRHQDRWPIFATHRVNNSLTCRSGRYALATVLTPTGGDGRLDPGRKVLVLVKGDVLRVE